MNKKIASILLNYNSNNDLFLSVNDLLKQEIENHFIIIIDNCSTIESINELKEWQKDMFPSATCGTPDDVSLQLTNTNINKIIFVFNDKNYGYSAGNNIGISIAQQLNAYAVLIVNPDMRIKNNNYINKLLSVADRDEKSAIVTSRIIGVDGKDQSPMVSDNFWREFLWPKQLFPKLFGKINFIEKINSHHPIYVSKVIGCCMLIKMDFLQKISFLDETTFLYSEEAILSAQVEHLNKKIVFVPHLYADHIHIKENKEKSSSRMLLMITSRLFYIKKYSNYSSMQKLLLFFSYKVWYLLHYLKK